MTKLSCGCGYIFDLTPIPDEGYIVIKDIDYEEYIKTGLTRETLCGVKQGTKEWDKLIDADRKVIDYIERLYECPNCGNLIWERNSNINNIYKLVDKVDGSYKIIYKTSDSVIIKSFKELQESIDILIRFLSHKKYYRALRDILDSWPFANGFTEDWHELHNSLVSIKSGVFQEDEVVIIGLIDKCIKYVRCQLGGQF